MAPLASSENRRTTLLGLAALRVVALPVGLGITAAVEHVEVDGWLVAGLAAGAVYSAASAVLASRPRQERFGVVYAPIDLAFACVSIALTGGETSPVRWTLLLGVATAGFLLTPIAVAILGAASLLVYGLDVLLTLTADRPAPGSVVSSALFLGWSSLAGVLLAMILSTRSTRLRAVVAQAGQAEATAQTQFSEMLHAGALQDIAIAYASLALTEGQPSPKSIDSARHALEAAVGKVRLLVGATHPLVAHERGLEATLDMVGHEAAAVGGFAYSSRIELASAAPHDELIVSLARELLMNAANHSAARHVWLALERASDQVLLEVGDDGRGIDISRLAGALGRGHIGLAAAKARAEAVGGRLTVEEREEGALVRVALPA